MDTIAFARGVPAPEMLPIDELRAASARAFERDPIRLLSYGGGGGYDPLRRALGERHGVEPEQVVITTGSLQGFSLLAQVLARRATTEGRRARVIVEEPTYDRPLLLLERLGIEVVPVPLDGDGVDVDALDRAMARGADLAYLIPTYQNPAGATLNAARRRSVVASAKRHAVLVLEDDPYGLLHFDQPAPPTLFSQRGEAPIAFSGSFSKTVSPGLRVGWFVLPHDLAFDVATLANDTYISASLLAQATVHEYIESGEFEPNVDRCRGMLADRCTQVLDSLQRHLPEATFTAPAGGYFIWIRLPDGLNATTLLGPAAAAGVTYIPGSSFGADCDAYARIAFSSPPLDQIDAGVGRLAAACATALSLA